MGRSRTFLCEDPSGRLIGACCHEVTNGKLMIRHFGGYLTIVKQDTRVYPSGQIIQGRIIDSKIMNPKNKRLWVDYYMSVFHTNVLTDKGETFIVLKKYNKVEKLYLQYINLKILE